MLNGDLKTEAINSLKKAHKDYEERASKVAQASIDLMQLRRNASESVISSVEEYINTMSCTPKEFDKSIADYKAEFETFNSVLNAIEIEAHGADVKAGVGAATGIAAGVGTAALAPTAAMAIATTFGAASTGTAISALSGAAATNAALAWLGGGALAAGGGGMAGGSALLALSGPLGWAIGGAALIGSGMFARSKNRKIAEEANQKRKKILIYDASLKAANVEIESLSTLTIEHSHGTEKILDWLKINAPTDYSLFNSEQKSYLSSLINHIESLSKLLNKKIDA